MENKFFSLLGLAQRAGKLVSGEGTCEIYIKKKEVSFVIVTKDASDNTKKKFQDMCQYRDINFVIYGNREMLSRAIGKHNRAVFAVKDVAFAEKLYELILEVENFSNTLGGE